MPLLTRKARLAIGLAGVLGFLVLLATATLQSSRGFAKSGRQVGSIHDAIEVINETEKVLVTSDQVQSRVLITQKAPDGFNFSKQRRVFQSRIASLALATRLIRPARSHIQLLLKLGLQKLDYDERIVSAYQSKGYSGAISAMRDATEVSITADTQKEFSLLRQILLQRLKQVAADNEIDEINARWWLEAGLVTAVFGATVAVMIAFRDSRRRLTVEQSYQTVAALQQAILDSVSCLIISTDRKGVITGFNRLAERMLGYHAEELIGKQNTMIFHDPDEIAARAKSLSEELGVPVAPNLEVLKHNALQEQPAPWNWTLIRKDGSKFQASVTASPILDAAGELIGFVGVVQDLTEFNLTQAIIDASVKEIEAANRLAQQQNQELKRTAQELKQSRDAAITATRMKSEFLANMSHEIRTPMNGVIGMTHLLLNTPLNKKQLSYARTVQQSAESLLSILNDILDLSKMEAGKMTLEHFPFDLRLLLEDLCDALAPSAHAKQLELNCVFPPVAPTQVIGDPGRLRQVLTNLLGNAIKFTERGEVSVSVRTLKENKKRVTYRFSVADTGIGISPDRQERIFDSFTQADGSTTRKFGGTGLGLTICRQLTELMGGEIGVYSNLGAGSEFWLELAFQKQPATVAQAVPATQDLAGIRILVADDNATNRYILREMLVSWNCRLVEVANGTEALSAISLSANDPFTCVIMDLHMPGMDGLDTARAIKLDHRHRDLPIILLSSSGFTTTDNETAMLYAAVLTKPVRTSPLYNALTQVTGISHVPAGAPAESHPIDAKPLAGVRVLVVEDNAVNQLVVTELLLAWGCVVSAAENGLIAVATTKNEKFDVILMDVQMPVMDGFEATAAIRAQEKLSGTRTDIVAMTANAMTGDRERCLRAGMDSYLSKPLQPSALLERIANSAGRQLIGDKPAEPTPSESPTIDLERLNESCSGNADLKLKVIERFLVTSLDSMAQISQSVANGEANAAKSAAHALKGSSVTIGSAKVGKLCEEIELAANSETFGMNNLSLAEDLTVELLAVHQELKAYAKNLGSLEA